MKLLHKGTVKATLSAQFGFEAAHRMEHLGAEHPNSRIHGHSYLLRVHVEGEIDPSTGVVMDHQELMEKVRPLVEQLDHSFLNEIPELKFPSGEMIARWAWQKLEPSLRTARSRLTKVDVERPSIAFVVSYSGI